MEDRNRYLSSKHSHYFERTFLGELGNGSSVFHLKIDGHYLRHWFSKKVFCFAEWINESFLLAIELPSQWESINPADLLTQRKLILVDVSNSRLSILEEPFTSSLYDEETVQIKDTKLLYRKMISDTIEEKCLELSEITNWKGF